MEVCYWALLFMPLVTLQYLYILQIKGDFKKMFPWNKLHCNFISTSRKYYVRKQCRYLIITSCNQYVTILFVTKLQLILLNLWLLAICEDKLSWKSLPGNMTRGKTARKVFCRRPRAKKTQNTRMFTLHWVKVIARWADTCGSLRLQPHTRTNQKRRSGMWISRCTQREP
jgi:hypothetical protein